jgi:NAD(P)-dependent dehydrogenase (short-subunit alcohol dehydrogenase family)
LAGKVALITGGARGQGAEEGRLFAAEGATVVLCDVADDDGERTAGEIAGADYRHLDVRSEAEWTSVVAEVVARHGGLDVLGNNAGIEWGRHGIRVNSVHPGVIETPMTASLTWVADPDTRAKMLETIPLGRLGQSVDIANIVLFPASDESSYCTGHEFTVDGGIHT